MALKKRSFLKTETKTQPRVFSCVRTSKFEGFTGFEPKTSTCFRLLTLVPTIFWQIGVFFLYKDCFLIFGTNHKIVFFCAPQQWTREGVRLASHLLWGALLISYYQWILFVLFKWLSHYLFGRSQSFLFLSRGVEFGSLWAPKLCTEHMFLNIQHCCQSARGWCILELALQGPSQTTEIDANRSAVFRNGF